MFPVWGGPTTAGRDGNSRQLRARTPRTGVHRRLDRAGHTLVKSKSAQSSRAYPGGIIVSLTLQSDAGAQAAALSRRSALSGAGSLHSIPAEESVAPSLSLIAAGWYADPMGSLRSRWWDGNAWTVELSVEALAEPAAAAAETVAGVPFIEVPVLGNPAVDIPTSEPLSRRDLRGLVGPLTTGPVQLDTSAEAAPATAATPTLSASLSATVAGIETGTLSPFEALFESSAVERESAEAATPTFSSPAFGFTLPPDPFATPSAALAAKLQAVPLASVPLPVPSATIAPAARSTTAAVWLFTLLPVVHASLVWFELVWLGLGSDRLVLYSVVGAPLFLYLVLAVADRQLLRSRGFERTAPVVLALVPPIYLLVRAIRVGGAGVVPLLLWLLLQITACSFLLIQFPVLFAVISLTSAADSAPAAVLSGPITDAQRSAELTPSGMAAELTRQAQAKNLTFSSISCPPIPVALDGTAVTCVGTLASVKMNLNVVIDSKLPNSAFVLVSEAPAA